MFESHEEVRESSSETELPTRRPPQLNFGVIALVLLAALAIAAALMLPEIISP
jgi:hypothetical protein